MLKDFMDFASFIVSTQRSSTVEAHITEGQPSDNRSARLDVTTLAIMARITYWESGEYYAEAIAINSEQQIYSDNGRLKANEILSERFAPFLELIGIVSK